MDLKIDDVINLTQDFMQIKIEHHYVFPDIYDYFIKYEVHV